MSPYLRQVKTASGATAVQVVVKENGVRRIVEHLGSALVDGADCVLVVAGSLSTWGQLMMRLSWPL